MGKFGDDRDKLVGEGSYENHSSVRLSGKALSKTKKSSRTHPYFSDSLLIPRINQYLAENKEKVYIDINEMVNDLQSRYREYARRKKYAFRQSVQKAFNIVLQQCGINQEIAEQGDEYVDSTDNSSSDVEECNVGENYESFKASSNNQIINLYTPKRLQFSKNVQKNASQSAELIDLSSDDENIKKKDENEEIVTKEAKSNCLPNHSLLKETLSAPGSKIQNKTGKPEKVPLPSRKRKLGSHSGKVNYLTKQKRLMFQEPKVTFADFGGNTKALEEVCKLILHVQHPEFYKRLGLTSPRGFLLHGPPGCGKTLLASAIAGELNVHFLKVSAPELVGGVSGESEERIRELFESAVESAPCVLFIDEVDAITPNRQNAQREMERRIVAQLLTCLDELNSMPNGDQVLVIGATNRPDSLDPALRRAGRFDREVCLGIPDLKAREQILRVLCKDLRMSQSFSYEEIAVNTPGFVGADLLSLTREAAMIAFNRVFGALLRNNEDKQVKKKKMKLESDESRSEAVKGDSLFNKLHKDSKDCEGRSELPSEKMDTGSSPVIPKMQIERTGEGVPNSKDCGTGGSLTSEKMDTGSSSVIPQIRNERFSEEIPDGKNLISVNNGGEAQPTNSNLNKMHTENEKREQKKMEKTSSDMEVGETVSEESLNCGDIEICKDDSVKTVGSDDESEVEVLAASYVPEPPNLTTLLNWIRCIPPLTYDELESLYLTQDDFNQALRCVQPSAKREGFATVPDVTWNDIGSLADVREELKMSVLGPVKMRKQFEQLGLTVPSGILICGPPGCGKTLLAKAVANEAGINFISVKGPELLNMYVGESERAVRQCFQRARNSAPCVIFFDELDALCPKRSGSGENVASSRVVNQMLTEMDGVEDRKEVYLMAATNRPDIVDPAVLRPGRLDKIMYVGLPEADGRVDILKALTKNGTRPKLASDVNLVNIAKRPECNGYSGADLAALVREAGVQALKDLILKNETNAESEVQISMIHFERALNKIRPSVSSEDRVYYEHMRKKYCFSDSSGLSP